jgi:acyl-CoA synthetase (AMP-forming)/AMP-acid ligase II
VAEAIAAGATSRRDDELHFARVDGETTTIALGRLHEGARRLAGKLFGAGVLPGSAVLVQAPADAASTEVLVALWMLGAVPVPLATKVGEDELSHVARETAARTAIVASEWRGNDLAAQARDADIERVLVIGEPLRENDLPSIPRPDPQDVAVVLYTSGSTAAPKGVMHPHETLLFGVNAVPADGATRSLASFPAGHVASLLGLLRPLTVGGTTVVMDRWSARAAAQLIEEHGLTASAGTPFFLRTLLDEAERSGRDISSLARFLVGAATVPPALVERADAAGIVTWRTYGSTEHPAIASGGPTDQADKRRLTDGRPTPGNEVRLLDEHGDDVEPGSVGEIVARGPKQFVGYRDASLDSAAFVDGTWFRTGDLARFDDDGYLVVTDRVKDVVIRGGENISAREVEDALADHPAVQEVAVCSAPDDIWGEIVCAFVLPREGPPPTLVDLQQHASARGLAPHKEPARLIIVDELPRTSAGKVRKRDLKARAHEPVVELAP